MKTVYYSDITNEYYDSIDECRLAEKRFRNNDVDKKELEGKIAALEIKMQEKRKEFEQAKSDLVAVKQEYHERFVEPEEDEAPEIDEIDELCKELFKVFSII